MCEVFGINRSVSLVGWVFLQISLQISPIYPSALGVDLTGGFPKNPRNPCHPRNLRFRQKNNVSLK